MTIEQDIANLQKQISELKQKETPFTTAVTINPFTTLGERKIEQGSTGSSRKRIINFVGDQLVTSPSRFNLTVLPHLEFLNSQNISRAYIPIKIPSDYIENAIIPSINFMWATTVADNTVDWAVVSMDCIIEGNTVPIQCLESFAESVTAPSVAGEYVFTSFDLTIRPKVNSLISLVLNRDGVGDSNSGNVGVYGVWLEYIAFS